MKKFDTKVQLIKYKVLKQVAKHSWSNTLLENVMDIPNEIVPGKKPTMRCCIYKEKAILSKRIKLAIGGSRYDKKTIKVIDIACEDCPTGGYEVTSACKGCLARRCAEACKRDAITFGHDQKAYIDKTKCVECGLCAKVCPYNAINNFKRPCEVSCKVKAISMGAEKEAVIDYSKCTACGSCVYMCPFGAITDRSYILDVIDILKHGNGGENYNVYALIAPSIAGQFKYAKLGQVLSAIKLLGFNKLAEVAEGAEEVALKESRELAEKGFLISSCCPAFVDYIEKNFPDLKDHVSKNLSPAGTLAKKIRSVDENAKIVFIGPCTAKKREFMRDEYRGTVDCVITFEELQALIDSKDIDVTNLPEQALESSSYFGRVFARSGGLCEAVSQAIKEQGLNVEFNPVICNGIEECKTALLKARKGVLNKNFIEGMACIGGCISGAGCINHSINNTAEIDKYATLSNKKNLKD